MRLNWRWICEREALALLHDMTPAQRDVVLQLMRTIVDAGAPTMLQAPKAHFSGRVGACGQNSSSVSIASKNALSKTAI
jgi:hypothetical protein